MKSITLLMGLVAAAFTALLGLRDRFFPTRPAPTAGAEPTLSAANQEDLFSALVSRTNADSLRIVSSKHGRHVVLLSFASAEPVIAKVATETNSLQSVALFAEAQALSYLSSRASDIVPQLLSIEELPTGVPALFRSHVRGLDLHSQMRETAINSNWPSVAEAVSVIRSCCAAVAQVHDAGVVHGDIKPANFVLAFDNANSWRFRGSASIIDFGSAQFPRAAASSVRSGTWGFSAPERFFASVTQFQSDVYSLASLAAFVFIGRPGMYGLSSKLRIPEPLREVIERGLADNPFSRQASGGEFYDEFLDATKALGRRELRSEVVWPAGWKEDSEMLITHTLTFHDYKAKRQIGRGSTEMPPEAESVSLFGLEVLEREVNDFEVIRDFVLSGLDLDEYVELRQIPLAEMEATLRNGFKDAIRLMREEAVARFEPA